MMNAFFFWLLPYQLSSFYEHHFFVFPPPYKQYSPLNKMDNFNKNIHNLTRNHGNP